ncbi:MAG: mechanosensitive ion channel [Anaerolineales bacterium]|nr:mechanosensitive ion channel [Anaerolineales bacterium]
MQKEVLEIFNMFKTEAAMLLAWGLVLSLTAAGVAIFLKNVLENGVSYFLFMVNKRLGINVRVEVRGTKGTITGYNKRWIFIKTDVGDEIIIPIKNWQSEKWKLLNPDDCKDKEEE